MTEKELLYIEDTLSHEEQIIEVCNCFLETIEDQNLKKVLQNVIKKHQKNYDEFFSMLK